MSKTLEEIREKIDSLDHQIHDLFLERVELVSSVLAAKKEAGEQIVQPAREAQLMRRLLARHRGELPFETLMRIWRELVSSVAQIQTEFNVVVSKSSEKIGLWDMARHYFGCSTVMRQATLPQNAVAQVITDEASFAVVPWPELDEESPWWSLLFTSVSDQQVSVVVALPYEGHESEGNVFERACVVSKISFMPSGDDISFIGLNVVGDISRAKVVDLATDAGFEVLNLYRGALPQKPDEALFMLEVKGYIETSSDLILSIKDTLGEHCLYCAVMGGYPVIPDYSALN